MKSSTILVVIIFSFFFSLTMLTSGWFTSSGLVLWGVNAKDGIWNLALIEELRHHFPPYHPGFAGQPLRGYHFLYHLLLAIVSKITFIPVINLYFHIFPLIISFLWGWGVYLLILSWFNKKNAAVWSVFFSFFGGSFAFVLPLIGQKDLSIDSGFGIAQPFGSSLVNPAFASSIVLVIWSLYALFQYLKTGRKKWALLLIIASGLSVGFKVYAGMILLGAFLVSSFWRLLFEKKADLLLYCLLAIFLAVLVFFPFNKSYGFLVWAPLWPPHRVMQGPLNFTRWDELWAQYHSYLDYFGLLKLEIWAFLVFFFGNLGTRILAFFSLREVFPKGIKNPHMRKLDPIMAYKVYYLTAVGCSFFIPLFFLQPTGGGFNIIQMYWYFLFLVSLLVGPGVVKVAESLRGKLWRFLFYFLLLIFTLPSSLVILRDLTRFPSAAVDWRTLKLLNFLKNYKTYETTVLEIPKKKIEEEEELERWFWQETSVLIPALGGKRLYVADEIVSFPYEDKGRRLRVVGQIIRPWFFCSEENWGSQSCQDALSLALSLLKREKIALIYSPRRVFWLDNWEKIRLIFSNERGEVYEVLSL